MNRGLYLVLEGGDGSGKTEQGRRLSGWLAERGHTVRHLREPGSTAVGEALRRLLLDPRTGGLLPLTEALLFSAARAEMLRTEVEPLVRGGGVAVVERCYLSTLVYQGLASGVALPLLRELTDAVHGALWPDRIFLLDVDPSTRRQRADAAGKQDRFESRDESFHRAVREGYRELGGAAVHEIDARGSIETVHAELRRQVEGLLAERSA
ncbi:MAG: dTMP kinase [Planctomycetes bacterium]|nr:dTMP kinase [Planctomycetota bacterium]MCB9869470.1 dTMP kinase [Planctomycetota bacterium]